MLRQGGRTETDWAACACTAVGFRGRRRAAAVNARLVKQGWFDSSSAEVFAAFLPRPWHCVSPRSSGKAAASQAEVRKASMEVSEVKR